MHAQHEGTTCMHNVRALHEPSLDCASKGPGFQSHQQQRFFSQLYLKYGVVGFASCPLLGTLSHQS